MYDHHALLLIGPHEACLAQIPEEHRHGADAELLQSEQLMIDDVRALIERAANRPVATAHRHFIISVLQLTLEAQNALLKLFEDPPKTARFYLVVPRASVLIPTVRSRMHLVAELAHGQEDDELVETFLRSSYAERLEQIAKLHKAKDAGALRALIEGIERRYARMTPMPNRAVLEDILFASQYAEVRGGSPKMLLEHLALSLPMR